MTVTVAVPCFTPVKESLALKTETVATPPSVVSAPKVSVSPSGSLKWADSSIAAVSPLNNSKAGTVSVTTGGRFGTVTRKVCEAVRPAGSRAVTVTVVVPFPTPVNETVSPDEEAAAMSPFVDSAV